MKNLILGFALLTVAVACKSNDRAEVTSTEGASAPEAGCCDAGEDMASGCDTAAKAECSSEKVCPVTGKPLEN
jgi:hypothetical protein